MPIFEYECQECGDIFEVLQKRDDPPPAEHSCGSTKVRKVMSASSFVLKGEGWYITDYARKEKEAKEKKKKKDDSGSGSEASSDSSSDKKTKASGTSSNQSSSAA